MSYKFSQEVTRLTNERDVVSFICFSLGGLIVLNSLKYIKNSLGYFVGIGVPFYGLDGLV